MMTLIIILAIACIARGVQGCNYDGKLKSVGQSCKADSECYSGGSTDAVSCKAGLCACNDEYVAQLQWFFPNEQRRVCLPAPYQDQACTSICQKPFTCASSPTPGMKTCQCLPPAKVFNGMCYLECKSDEVFENGECKKRCAMDENKERYICKKLAKLGEKCDSKNQCSAPFSQCVNGVCSCPNGFSPNAKRDACESTLRWCPVGSPIRSRDNKIVECKVSKKPGISGLSTGILPFPRPSLLQDNCGPDQFCLLSSGEGYYADGAIGHCCPRPKFQCPYGRPHPSATCGQPIPNKLGVPPVTQYCPYGTHACIRFSLGGGYEESLCCPTACGSNQVLSGGVCYPKRNWGDPCQVNEQCKDHVGICENGKCTCAKDNVNEAGPGYHLCRRVCKDNEILVDSGRCLPRLKLGDACDPEVSAQCPANSYCPSEIRKCDCFCGYMKIGEDSCAPQPTCPDIKASRNPGILDALVNMTSITLCRIPGRPKPSLASVVESCPSGHYCSNYIESYGLCCPKPEKPFCPNGAEPGKQCDPKEPNACGPLGYCNRYFNPAGDDGSNEEYICCSALGPMLNLNQTDLLLP